MEAVHRQMSAFSHESDDHGEDHEISGFGRSQWVCFEERDHMLAKISVAADPKPIHVFPVVVVPAVAADRTTFEEPLQRVQNLHTPRSLYDRELGLDLPTESTRSIAEDRNAEAAFAVDEADDPLRNYWPFLLIVRTGRIVTIHLPATLRRGCDSNVGSAGYTGFPAFSQLHSPGLLLGGATPRARPGFTSCSTCRHAAWTISSPHTSR
jgi:hypothetical protein